MNAETPPRSIWLPDWSGAPYWHEDAPPEEATTASPPASVDVLIVGSGYTGLNAAIETAGGGRDTLVLDKDAPGFGCSTRNGGQIGHSIKPDLETLTRRHGAARADAIMGESRTALDWIEERIDTLGIDCDFSRVGRFHAAHSADSYEALARGAERLTKARGAEVEVVPRAEQRRELGTDAYHGGVVYPRDAGLHPAKYHLGLLAAARAAGARVIGHCAVTGLERTEGGYSVATEQGTVTAREVIVATNGYTGPVTPWLRRRVIPIGSYIIATEELPAELMDRLFPTDRVISDTRKVVYYYRPSPDRRRVLFGGRVSASETDPAISGPRLHEDMCALFPELRDTRISHSWLGHVAYTFDELMHVGQRDGVHYAMGYCGTGVSMASYLGMRMGQKVLGAPEGRTAFDDLPFPTRPFYTGNPWFLPPMVAWYRWRDRMQQNRKA
ncbi:FAD-binding oxidoreductase [Roseovarius sp. SCSIO 43702]|uniref:NAD(P)/FAD-dependent oxidoreductase n=1 Tax=Roseovarius sp. SCSIO 43702 TaxID=2823043 RepID=UPI001C735F38|nr:FAD-binding oxidoreductase [Roseovarius sp. SCSIO 43702]QYX55710.1 FAD-binding oxidoreductase [Roseovarius sp. SCSIO 43702]